MQHRLATDCFVSLNQGRQNIHSVLYNRWDFKAIPEQPAGKGSKRSRIYTRLNERFTSSKMHYRETHDTLIDQTIMLGPKMAHDDVIESLDLACLRSYPPDKVNYNEYGRHGVEPKKRKKSWVTM